MEKQCDETLNMADLWAIILVNAGWTKVSVSAVLSFIILLVLVLKLHYVHISCFYYIPLIWYRYQKSAFQNIDLLTKCGPESLFNCHTGLYLFCQNVFSPNNHQYGSILVSKAFTVFLSPNRCNGYMYPVHTGLSV